MQPYVHLASILSVPYKYPEKTLGGITHHESLQTTRSFWLGTGSFMFVSCRHFCLFGCYTNHPASLLAKV